MKITQKHNDKTYTFDANWHILVNGVAESDVTQEAHLGKNDYDALGHGYYPPSTLSEKCDIHDAFVTSNWYYESNVMVETKYLYNLANEKSFREGLRHTYETFPKEIDEEVFNALDAFLKANPDYTLCTIHRPGHYKSGFKPVKFGKRKRTAYFGMKDGSVTYKGRNVYIKKLDRNAVNYQLDGETYYECHSWNTVKDAGGRCRSVRIIPVTTAKEAEEVHFARALEENTFRLKNKNDHIIAALSNIAGAQFEYRKQENKVALSKEAFNEVVNRSA